MTNEYTKEIDRLFETYGPDKKTILLYFGKRNRFSWDYYVYKGTEVTKVWNAIDPDDTSLSIRFSREKDSLDDMVFGRISGIFDFDKERAKCEDNESLLLYVNRDYQVYSCVNSTPSITKSEKLLLDLSSYKY